MNQLITGASTFSKFLRFQLCTKQRQVLNRKVYTHRLWGSQIKGGLEVCDALLFENKENPFSSTKNLENRLKECVTQLKKELKDKDTQKSFLEYTSFKISQIFGKLNKIKIDSSKFEEDIRIGLLRGSLTVCEDLLNKNEKDPTNDVDVMMGDVHIIRMNLWNDYVKKSKSNNLKRVDIYEAMEIAPLGLTKRFRRKT